MPCDQTEYPVNVYLSFIQQSLIFKETTFNIKSNTQ